MEGRENELSSLCKTLPVLTDSAILFCKPVPHALFPSSNKSQHNCISRRPTVEGSFFSQARIPSGDGREAEQPFPARCSETSPYRVGRSPLFGSGVIAVLSYVELVGGTEMNVSLLESFENRPCKGKGRTA